MVYVVLDVGIIIFDIVDIYVNMVVEVVFGKVLEG